MTGKKHKDFMEFCNRKGDGILQLDAPALVDLREAALEAEEAPLGEQRRREQVGLELVDDAERVFASGAVALSRLMDLCLGRFPCDLHEGRV